MSVPPVRFGRVTAHQVIDIPGLPPGVEVRRSARRRRSVTAYREQGLTIVVVPQRMSRAEILPYVHDLLGRLESREKRSRPSDEMLATRAAELALEYLHGRAEPASVRWVSNQRRRWGSCTPADRSIRLSDRLQGMPTYVIDYVLLHELVHLLVVDHNPQFEAWMQRYERVDEARAFLAGVDHALQVGGAGSSEGSSDVDGAHDVDDVEDVDGAHDSAATDGADGPDSNDGSGSHMGATNVPQRSPRPPRRQIWRPRQEDALW